MTKICLSITISFFCIITVAAADRNYCGHITSLPDGFVVKSNGASIFFAGDNSAPPDPKGVYDYLNTHHKDSDRGCYCISGIAKGARLTSVSGLSHCNGAPIK